MQWGVRTTEIKNHSKLPHPFLSSGYEAERRRRRKREG